MPAVDPAVLSRLAADLEKSGDAVFEAAGIHRPDTGEITQRTHDLFIELSRLNRGLAEELGDHAGGLRWFLKVFGDADQGAASQLDQIWPPSGTLGVG